MPIINDVYDNNLLKELINEYSVEPPNFWVGDLVTFNNETKDIVEEKYGIMYWDENCNKYISDNIMMKFKVIYKRKYDKHSPWWSRIKNEINNEELWVVDEGLIKMKNEPSYKPKKINRTLESTKTKTRYRIKTREEFEKEFGENWNTRSPRLIAWNSEGRMDYLFGHPIFLDSDINLDNYNHYDAITFVKRKDDESNSWIITKNMIKLDEPSYKPKKIERTLESINLEHTGYVFEFNNIEDFIEMQIKLFKNGIVWITGDDTVKSTLDELDCSEYEHMDYPIYIFIDVKRKKFFWRPNDDLDYDDPIRTLRYNVDDKSNISTNVHSINEFNLIFKNEPSYKPRKIERFLEKDNTYDTAEEITIIINNVDELIILRDAIEPLGYKIPDGLFRTDYEIPLNIFIEIKNKIITYTSLSDDQRNNWENTELLDGVFREEYTIQDLPTIIRILRDKKIIPKAPLYNPRKIDRTLEQNSLVESINIEDYLVITDNRTDSLNFEDFLHKNGFKWGKIGEIGRKYLLRDTSVKQVLFVKINKLNKLFTGYDYEDLSSNWIKENYPKSIVLNYPRDISKINNLICPAPSYNPKKIDRTLESMNQLKYFNPIKNKITEYPYRFKIEEEFEKKFGENWRRIVGRKWVSPDMDFLYGIDYTDLTDKNIEYFNNINDTKPSYERFLISTDMLIKNRLNAPSYEPRKIDRIIENKINESVKDSYYFSKYNSLIIIVDVKITEEQVKYLGDIYHKVFGELFPWGFSLVFQNVYDNDDSYYIAIRKSGVGWGNPEMLEENNKSKNSTFPKYFRLSQLNTLDNINNVLEYGDIIPSYKPKKIDRSIDESADYLELNYNGKYLTLEYLQKDSIPFAFDGDDNLVIGENGTAHSDFFIEEYKDNFRNDYYISPKDYEEHFNKICPPIIPIKDIEDFYDIEFKDYYVDLYSDETVNRLEDYKYTGRLWLNPKVIAFWDYPIDNDEMKEVINRLEKRLNIEIWNDEWMLSITDKFGDDHLISIKDYEKSENPPKEEWINHIKSPLLKSKKVPFGYGSKHPKYMDRRAWQMASLTSENVKYDNEIYDKLKKGKYDLIIFKAPTDEEKLKIKDFLLELEIIGALYHISTVRIDNKYFGIFVKTPNNNIFEEFFLYAIDRPLEIKDFLKLNYNYEGEISPLFNSDELIHYINECVKPSAVSMYKPKKIDRSI